MKSDMQKLKIPLPISCGLMLSYQCNAECRHCMYGCSPLWKRWISEDKLLSLLRQLAPLIQPSPCGPGRVSLSHGLHFTGGEPFLNYPLLLKAVIMAEEMGIPSTFVETNCWWCASDEETLEKLLELKEAGLKGIMISVNPYYLEYVPFERTERCFRIASEVFGANTMIYQWDYYAAFKSLVIKGRMSLETYLTLVTREDLRGRVELFLMGRAAYQLQSLYPKYPPEAFFNETCQPPFIRNWHNHIDLYGNFIPGFCGGISLGKCDDLSRLISEGVDLKHCPVLAFLVAQDFRGLLQFAREQGYRELQEGYVSLCHLCVDIRKYLVEQGEFEELQPKEFYVHVAGRKQSR